VSAIPLRRIEGKYEILEKLGEGGMGAVYKVRHRLLDDVRVIKMMRPQLVADEEFKARFQREARVAIQLRHPNIAHLIDFTIDEEDGTAFIVMEFIDGMTLEEVLRHSGPPPSLGLALEIAQQSLRAIGYLHAKGFVHRDISPDNLMLTADGDGQPQVKLIDLGIAKVLDAGLEASHLTGTGIFLGKVRYSPPEQFGTEGAAMVDARGDLYSFGVVFYELLTGRYPIQGRDPSSLIAGHLFRPPIDFAESDPGGRLPPELRSLVLRALAKEPGQRFSSARELAMALATFRFPGDVADGDLKRALTRLPSGTVRVSLPPPGSTQDRLDLQFGLRTTPSRGSPAGAAGKTQTPSPVRRNPETELRMRTLLREAESLLGRDDFEGALEHLQRGKVLAPGNAEILTLLGKAEAAVHERRQGHDLKGAQQEIEAALARSDYRAAERRLYQAEASFGEQEVFSSLHERLGELRRRDLEARRRAERLAVAVQGIEGAFDKGDLEEADRLLSQAVPTYGEEASLVALRDRLEGLRRAAGEATRQTEIAALLAKARKRRETGDLEGALTEARQIFLLDAENAIARALVEEIEAECRRRQDEAQQAERIRTEEIEAERRRREEEARQAQREAARQAEIEALLASARERRQADDLDGTLTVARRVFALEAENAAALALVEEVEGERRRREKEAQRAEQLAAAIASIDACLDREDPEAAAKLLPGIVAVFGNEPSLRERWERIEDLRHRKAHERAAFLMAQARKLQAAGELEAALGALREAGSLLPEDPDVRTLLREVAAAIRRRDEESSHQRELETALSAIDEGLELKDLAGAARLLPAAVARFGGLPALRERWERLEALQRKARVEALQAEALSLQRTGHLDRAVRKLRQALELDPGNPAVASLLAELSGR